MDIKKIYEQLSEKELINALEDISIAESTGSFSENSPIRKLCKQTSEITKLDVSSNLLMVQMNVYKEASKRYMEYIEQKEIGSIGNDLDIKHVFD